MSVTLDVSKLSGWLNAEAEVNMALMRLVERQRVEEHDAHVFDAGGAVEAQRLVERRRAYEHAVHFRDAGGVEAQRLVERRRALSRVKRRAYAVRGELRPGRRREAAGDGGASSVQGTARLQTWGRGSGGAHVEHVAHVFDAGGVEAQRLVERRRVEEHVAHVRDAGGVEAQRLVERHRAVEHLEHGCDAGGVEAQRLVERPRAVEHLVHACDAGGVPAGHIRVETLRVFEEVAHVGDGRDVPVGDGAVRRSGGSRVSVVSLDRRPQGGRGRECGRAGPRTPARAIASRGEG
eukprot:scaffold92250_cov61-Phaeocystis_antarctica.AAC.3